MSKAAFKYFCFCCRLFMQRNVCSKIKNKNNSKVDSTTYYHNTNYTLGNNDLTLVLGRGSRLPAA